MSRFDSMPVPKGSRGTFPLNKMHTSTMDFFRWDVLHMIPLVAKDVINLNIHAFVDGAPNPYPINGRINAGVYAFFVPKRIVWDGWKTYISDLESGLTIPYFTIGDLYDAYHTFDGEPAIQKDVFRYISNIRNLSSVLQFLDASLYPDFDDIPSLIRNLKLSALPLRAAQRIWFDWMRDKAHISDVVLSSYCKTDGGHIQGSELIQLITPKYRLFDKNYITTAFDAPSESIVSAPLSYTGGYENNNPIIAQDPSVYGQNERLTVPTSENTGLTRVIRSRNSVQDVGIVNPLLGTSIPDLRSSNSMQQYCERMLVAGKTVLSRMLALFGTSPTIEELQMSDYIGGHEEQLPFKTQSGSVTTTAEDGADYVLNGAGSFGYDPSLATFAGQKHGNITCPENGIGLENISYKTDEEGYLFVFGCLTPVPQYYQGLDREWTRGLDTFASDKFDFFHSDFENEGLQPVLNYEVCFSGRGNSSYDPRGVFGFQQKYMDYKYEHDSIGGDFLLPTSANGYKNMHLGRDIQQIVESLETTGHPVNEFLTPSILVQSTAKDKEVYDSKFTVASDELDHFIINVKIVCTANRPMMQNALPALSASESRNTSKELVETSGFRL